MSLQKLNLDKDKKMNEIILNKHYIKNELKRNNKIKNISNNILLRNSIMRKFNNYQESNLLELNAFNKQRLSEKRYQQLTDRKNHIRQSSKPTVKINTDQKKVHLQNQSTKKIAGNNHRSELFTKKNQSNIKLRYLFKANKAKNTSFDNLNKINITQPLTKKTNHHQSDFNNQQGSILNLNKSFSCKSRPSPYLINPQQLSQIFKNHQIQQPHNKINIKNKNDKNKRFYDQAVTHLFEMARKNILIGKVQSQMPQELGIKQIIIPKREDWAQKLKKYKQAILKKQENAQSKQSNQRLKKPKIPLKLRTKTDVKINVNRNRTQLGEKRQLWFDLIQKPFEPWQYQKISSNFFE